MAAAKKSTGTVQVVEFETESLTFHILGKTPFIANRMSEKAKNQILFPSGRKTAAEKKTSIKHDPVAEFRSSPYTLPGGPTLIGHLATAFKAAIRGAGVDVPGTTKAQLGRMLYVEGEKIPIYGVPKLFMSVTRSADIGKTPDVRTRAILPEWACSIKVTFVRPYLGPKVVANLLQAAGLIQGVGDWRPEKGSGNYGQFRICDIDDPDYLRIIETGGREAQEAAMISAQPYDGDTQDLMDWFVNEAEERNVKVTV